MNIHSKKNKKKNETKYVVKKNNISDNLESREVSIKV